ncbi:MAG TPA: serine/threonine-protein kinase [Verrucomicrobiae bacterium]|nr:serine/threonine-protein kinase [Verrucomicrobiae bacterium]
MGSGDRCKECGAVIAADSPGGFCPACLLRLALEKVNEADQRPDPEVHRSQSAVQNQASVAAGSLTEKPGDRIGRYRLLEEIGRGGCGVVYMAGQEEPVQRKVALKVIKLGMDTRQVVARFEAERQAVALMDHPNIAKVLDAGATDAGRPYFVMELVGGIKITDYCNQNQLTTRQRLDLFIQVCRAIQHAHQKGVIHRDIKPSNVLVATQDGEPVPKVIDFGIAKATQGKLTDDTVFTAFEQFLGTPAYMSPEQAQLGGLDVDTRSDIYSLGVLLYELLTGKTPFDAKELLAAGLDAMRRAIQEKEPPTPSTRLKQEGIAQQVQSSGESKIKNQKSKIANDLDCIVMKCLEKDRARRYETANGLAVDIERHLNNEPVTASPPGRLYRFQKLVRRNKVAATATAVVALVLVLGVVASTWQAVRARRAEQQARRAQANEALERQKAQNAQANEAKELQKAQTEAAKSHQVAQFLKDMLEGVGPSVARGRDTAMLREILDKTAGRIGRDLTNQPEVEMELQDILGSTYLQLGQYERMEEMQKENLRIARSQPRQDSLAAARALNQIAAAQLSLAHYDQAEQAAREALAIRQGLLGKENAGVADSLNTLGLVLRGKGLLAQAEGIFREALAMTRKTSGNDNANVAMDLANLAEAILAQTDSVVPGQAGPGGSEPRLAEAAALLDEALSIRRKVLGNDHPDIVTSLQLQAKVLEKQRKEPQAEAILREALALQRKLLGDEHDQVAACMTHLAAALFRQDKLAEAETLYRDSLAIQKKLLGDKHPEVASNLSNLGNVLYRQGKLGEAVELFRQALTIKRTAFGDDHPGVATVRYNLACTLEGLGQWAEAETLFRGAMPTYSGLFGAESPRIATLLNHVGEDLQKQGKLTEAEATYRHAFVMERKLLGDQHPYVATTADRLGVVLEREGKVDEVETLYRDRVQALRAVVPGDDPGLAHALAQLTSKLLGQGKFTNAEPIARECLAIREKQLPDDWRTFNTRSLLGDTLLGQQKYADAEPLLVSGYQGMAQRQNQIPAEAKAKLKESMQRLVNLYVATGQTNQAAEWKKNLKEFDEARDAKKASSPPRPTNPP